MQKTLDQYHAAGSKCREVFLKKTRDYGTSWRILRPSSLTDQLFIKAARIRSIEEKGLQKVSDSVEGEFIGLVNYSILALIQMELEPDAPQELDLARVEQLYDQQYRISLDLMLAKNHDYGEAWREMRISSFTDLILQKIRRVKQIEDNQGKTIISEGIEANYRDIINYAMFALIKIEEEAIQPN